MSLLEELKKRRDDETSGILKADIEMRALEDRRAEHYHQVGVLTIAIDALEQNLPSTTPEGPGDFAEEVAKFGQPQIPERADNSSTSWKIEDFGELVTLENGVQQNEPAPTPQGFTWWQSEPQTNPARFPPDATDKIVEVIMLEGYYGTGVKECRLVDWEFAFAYRILADAPSERETDARSDALISVNDPAYREHKPDLSWLEGKTLVVGLDNSQPGPKDKVFVGAPEPSQAVSVDSANSIPLVWTMYDCDNVPPERVSYDLLYRHNPENGNYEYRYKPNGPYYSDSGKIVAPQPSTTGEAGGEPYSIDAVDLPHVSAEEVRGEALETLTTENGAEKFVKRNGLTHLVVDEPEGVA